MLASFPSSIAKHAIPPTLHPGAIIGETQRTTQVSSGGFSQSPGTSAAAAKYYFPNTKLSTYRHSTFPKAGHVWV